jgi:RNA polymerase sigma factor (sigma-70 family)
MVFGVCRRVLRDPHDAEDAFQATFLVLVRKASSVVPAEMLPNWLYGVARQTAVRARALAARRRQRERQVTQMPEPEAGPTEPGDDLRPLLDQELAGLPSYYRVAVVLCDLEGKSHKEAAQHLDWPVGTVASRLSRGRRMLARRLTRRGVALSGSTLAAILSEKASANVPGSLLVSTLEAARMWTAWQAAAGAVSLPVATLTEGVLKAMLLNKIKMTAAVLFVLGLVALGGGLLTCFTAAADPPVVKPQDTAGPVPREREKPAVAAEPRAESGRFMIMATGKSVGVQGVWAGAELQATADLAWYNEENRSLVLKAAGDNLVKLRIQRGQTVETIEARKVILDCKTGSLKVDGPGKLEGAPGARSEATKDILVNVQEEKTGSLMFGLGVNSDSGLTGSIVLNERNFDLHQPATAVPGAGQEFRVEAGHGIRLSVPTLQGAGQEFRSEAVPGTQVQRFSWWIGLTR